MIAAAYGSLSIGSGNGLSFAGRLYIVLFICQSAYETTTRGNGEKSLNSGHRMRRWERQRLATNGRSTDANFALAASQKSGLSACGIGNACSPK
jgi:hypothetical protein